MTHYAIGDIQGCFMPFEKLLTLISFNPSCDKLWLTGDVVNRGLDSLQVLRFIKNLGDCAITVLGNHDLHLLSVAYGLSSIKAKDTFQDILDAPDKVDLCDWLRQKPLLHYDPELKYAMSHAGILPAWSLIEAQTYADEVEALLRGNDYQALLSQLYGDQPDEWHNELTGWQRYRFIINSFTRMRFCLSDHKLELKTKTGVINYPAELLPWFKFPNRAAKDIDLIFGHWAAVNGNTNEPTIHALDTGCIWGNCLTAMRLEDGKKFQVKC